MISRRWFLAAAPAAIALPSAPLPTPVVVAPLVDYQYAVETAAPYGQSLVASIAELQERIAADMLRMNFEPVYSVYEVDAATVQAIGGSDVLDSFAATVKS